MTASTLSRTLTRTLLAGAAAGGVLLSGVLLATTLAAPRSVERAAQAFLRSEVETSVRAQFGDRADTLLSIAQRTGMIGTALAARADSLRRLAASDWPERIAPILDAFCCSDSTSVDHPRAVREHLETAAALADERLAILRSFVTDTYRARLHELVDELRYFSTVNLVLFGLVGFLLVLHRSDMRPVLLPSVLLLGSTIAAAGIYLFGQDWFWRILLGDFMGAWYLALVGAVMAFAADIVLLKGRVTSAILNLLPAALVPPC